MKVEEMREALITFMKKKAKALEPWGGALYFTEEDERELREWPPFRVEAAFFLINSNISSGDFGDASICPWCQALGSVCSNCRYGERHGRCDSFKDNNTYGLILSRGEANVLEDLIEEDMDELWEASLEEAGVDVGRELEALVAFTKWRAEELAEGLEEPERWPSLFTPEDEQDLRRWPLHLIVAVHKEIDAAVEEGRVDDSAISPWCLASFSQCSWCRYAARHGKCASAASDHYQVVSVVCPTGSFVEWVGEDEVARKWKELNERRQK